MPFPYFIIFDLNGRGGGGICFSPENLGPNKRTLKKIMHFEINAYLNKTSVALLSFSRGVILSRNESRPTLLIFRCQKRKKKGKATVHINLFDF